MSFDERMKKVNAWCTKQGLDDLEDSDFIPNKLRIIDAETLEITAFINIYLKNGELYSTTIRFNVEKREDTKETT